MIDEGNFHWYMERHAVLWISGLSIVKVSILPRLIYRFIAISIKIPKKDFHGSKTNNPKVHMDPQRTPNS